MAQYIQPLANDKYKYFLDQSTGFKMRVGQRNHFFVRDKELYDGGFNDAEDVGWENTGGYGDPGDEVVAGGRIRFGVRDCDWCDDIELTPTGFDGVEDTDWKCVGSITWNYFDTHFPTGLTATIVDGGVKLDWTDNSGGAVQYQVWFTDNGVLYTQAGSDLAKGTETYTHLTASAIPLTYKIRAFIGIHYSSFTSTVTQIVSHAYYPLNRFYTAGAGNVKDYSGNNYHLTNVGGTILVSNKESIIYSAVSYDGSNDTINGTYPALCLSGEMTISAWIKPADLTTTQYIACAIAAGGGNQNFGLLIGLTDKRLSVLWGGSVIGASSTDLGTANWVHIAFVRSGSAGAWSAKFYLNGSPDGSANTAVNPSAATDNKFAIGSDTSAGIAVEYNGLIDDVRVYNRALSDSEIASIAAHSVDDIYHVFKQTVFTEASLNTLRGTLRGLIFTSGYPSDGVDAISLDVADPLTTSPTNLASVDELTVKVTGIADRTCYVWNPNTPNGKIVIHHVGHWKSVANAFEPAGMGDLTRGLVEAGYTVCFVPMPPGATGEGDTHDGMGYDGPEDLALFLEPTIRVLNEYTGQFTDFYMTGLSGGGWTTDLICALDTRITKGAAVAGSLPYYLTQSVPITRDFEQQLIGLIGYVDYADLFLMACTGGRKLKKYLNTLDPTGFNLANYNLDPFAPAINAITDNFELVWDVNNQHEISATTRARIISYFNE